MFTKNSAQPREDVDSRVLTLAEALSSCVCYLAMVTREGDLAAARLQEQAVQALIDAGQPYTLEECQFINDCVVAERLERSRIQHEQRLILTEEEAKTILRRALG